MFRLWGGFPYNEQILILGILIQIQADSLMLFDLFPLWLLDWLNGVILWLLDEDVAFL